MPQATYPFVLTDPFGRKFDCEYVFDVDEDGKPWCCSLWIHDACIDGEVDDYIRIWDAYTRDEKAREAEERMACASF